MSISGKYFEKLVKVQNNALRDPAEIICGDYERDGILKASLNCKVEGNFLSLLGKLKITLFVTREYENLVVGLSVKKGKLRQSFIHLPHPSGIAVNRRTKKVYIAATRNPNQIVELSPSKGFLKRDGYAEKFSEHSLMISRVKYYAGAYYFHDLAFIGDKLYANSVGQNGVIRVNFDSSESDKVVWSPLSKKFYNANHIQLNSIAAGQTLSDSYFSASAEAPGKYKPGDLKFPVNKKGVIFHGKTKRVVGRNLTRPHSAKLHKNKLWVNNSGYGQLGYIENGDFKPFIKLPGWTRGLSFVNHIAFVGVSKVIPQFKVYAPGIDEAKQKCGIYAVDIKRKVIIGSIEWPLGNQIFGIDYLDSGIANGFLFTKPETSSLKEKEFFFRHLI